MKFWEYIRVIFKKDPYWIKAPTEEWERTKWDLPSKLVIWVVPIILWYLAIDSNGYYGFFWGNISGWWITFFYYQWVQEKQEEKQRHIQYLNMGYKDYLERLLNNCDDEITGQEDIEDIEDLSLLWDGLTPESKIEIARDAGLSVSDVEPDSNWVDLSQEAKDALREELANIFSHPPSGA